MDSMVVDDVSCPSVGSNLCDLWWLLHTQVMILSQDKGRGRISLSTKKLEPTPGDMLRNPGLVYEKVGNLERLLS